MKNLMEYLETMQTSKEAQIGQMFIKVLENLPNLGLLKVRVITPIAPGQMCRFDVMINDGYSRVDVVNVAFYRVGDKRSEKEAIDA